MKIKHLVILFLVNCGQDTVVASPTVLLTQNKTYSNVDTTQTSSIHRNTYINIANAAGFIDAIASIDTYSTSNSDLKYKILKFEDKRVLVSEYKKKIRMKNSIKTYNTDSIF